MSCRARNLKLIIIIVLSAALDGCLPQGENHPGQGINTIPGDDVTAKPSVLCGKNRAVVGIDNEGTVRCGAPRLSGMTGKAAYLPCFIGEDEESVQVSSGSDQLEIPLCALQRDESADDVTLGAAPTDKFTCPTGSALFGFSEVGEPLCTSVVGSELNDVALIMPASECPFGMVDGQLTSTEVSLPICKYENSDGKVKKLFGERVVRFPRQANTQCQQDYVVVGFDQDHRIICGKGPKQFKNKIPSYISTKFDSGGFPDCGKHHEARNLALLTVNDRRPVNIWTCIRKDLAN
jgi:hypothetical protein